MASDRVELVWRSAEALNRGDLTAADEGLAEDVVWVVAKEHPAARTIEGLEQLRAYRNDWLESLPGLRFDIERIVEDDDRVIAVGEVSGTGSESGVGVGVPIAFAYEFRGDVIVRVEEYLDPTEPLGG
jgi:ketosteroid isomerase-like protein